MAPPRRILRQQLEVLMDFLEQNKDMAKGLSPGIPVSQQATRQKWAALAKKLNAVESGALKTPEAWKKYWFEWRHRCRSKAADARRLQATTNGGANRFVPLNDLEVRVIDLCGSGTVTATVTSSKQTDKFLAEDSDCEPLDNRKGNSAPIRSKVRRSVTNCSKAASDDEPRSVTPPPKWALEFEERRIAAEERMAEALESIASVMRSQEERRAMLDEQMVNAVTAMAGTVQDLNSGIHEALQHFRHLHPVQNGMDSKDHIYY